MGSQPHTVVVIDDEQDVTAYLGAVLSDEGFEVFCAADGHAGLALIREHHPAMVCLDLLMPEQTGLSLYREMHEDPEMAGIPVLIVSGLGMEKGLDHVLAGLPRPAGYIEKPIALDHFIARVHQLTREAAGA